MKRAIFLFLPFVLTACAEYAYQQPYVPQPPTITQIQGRCFASYEKFDQQANCINSAAKSSPSIQMSAYGQEYLANMQSLNEKVKTKKMSGADARLKLAQKLNEIGARENNDLAAQQQLEYQRQQDFAEAIRKSQPPPMNYSDLFPTRNYQLRSPTQTDCYSSAGVLHCTTN